MFKAKQVDAAVTWEPDLSGGVTARGDEAHVLVSTTAATNIIADTLVRAAGPHRHAPRRRVRDFVHGWFEGIEMMKADPAASYAVVGKALKLDDETVSGMLSGLKLTPFADNAQFYGLTGGKAHYETLFDTAFVIWRKKGLVTRPVDAKDWADTRFLSALAAAYPGQKVEEPKLAARPPSAQDRAIINKQIQIHFTPGSDEIMAGLVLRPRRARRDDDVVRQHLPARRGQHRLDRRADARTCTLSERRALAVKNYVLKNFPNIQPARFQTIGRGAANPVRRTRPRPAGSSTAAPTSRSSWPPQ